MRKGKKLLLGALLFAALFVGILLVYNLTKQAETPVPAPEEYAVLVRTESLSGQGVIYAAEGKSCFVVTAGHVLAGLSAGDFCTVLFSDGSKVQACIRYLSDIADVAFLEMETDGPVPGAPIWNRERFDAAKYGDSCFALDLDGEETRRIQGTLSEPWVYLEDFSLNMMLVKLPAKYGMSGCGIYSADGAFLGILCGMNDDGEAAVLPLSVIISEWEAGI